MARNYNEDTYIFRFTSLKDMLEEYTFTFPTKTGLVGFKHAWSLTCFSNFGEWHGSGSTSTFEAEIYKYLSPPYKQTIRTYKEGEGVTLFGKLRIEVIEETGTTAKVRYWVKPQLFKAQWHNALHWEGALTLRTKNAS